MDTNIQDIKIDLIQWITALDDEQLIQEIVALKKRSFDAKWDKLSAEEKKSIQKGIDDAENNRLKPHSEAKKIYEKWL
jgi:hypothetical protein